MNLFEGMGETNRSHENKALISKWSRTGLLEGLGDKQEEATVSVLLENQAKQLLKEGSQQQPELQVLDMSSGLE
jgi:hypothetical protein